MRGGAANAFVEILFAASAPNMEIAMQRYAICNDWEFTDEFTPAFARGEGEGLSVRIPHTCKQLPLSYFNEKSSEMVCGYRRRIDIPKN